MQLYIGNKNYSSWSMRPWVLMQQLGIAFEEVMLRFDSFDASSTFKTSIKAVTPTGRVPVLVDDGLAVWDSLAIVEYLAEKLPAVAVWPRDMQARARARSIVAEIHSGFHALRNACPMNMEAPFQHMGAGLAADNADMRTDLARIEAMWQDALQRSGGPFLFGQFSAADAMYAPVCSRIVTYGLPVSATTRGYVDRVFATPSVRRWTEEALAEQNFVAWDEPYRTQR